MEFTGRITADAKIHKLDDGREFINFTLAMNDRFTTKAGEKRDVATFIRCAYWVSPKIAPHLRKGSIISVYGRIGIDVYNNMQGEACGALTCHVHHIRFVSKAASSAKAASTAPAATEDLPF